MREYLSHLLREWDVETAINFVSFVVMTSSGIKTLLNFNPLIKLDGYYLLSDWLEISNLRSRSFAIAGIVAPSTSYISRIARRRGGSS